MACPAEGATGHALHHERTLTPPVSLTGTPAPMPLRDELCIGAPDRDQAVGMKYGWFATSAFRLPGWRVPASV